MSALQASARVPMVFSGPGVSHVGDGNVHALVSLVDLLPTFLVRAILVRALLPPGGRVRYRRWCREQSAPSRPLSC